MSDDVKKDFGFAVGGMTCASCAAFVEKSLRGVEGVEYASVNLTGGKAYVVASEDVSWEVLAAAVKKAGYEPSEDVPDEDELDQVFRQASARVLISWAAAIPAMVLMILHMAGVHIPCLPLLEAAAGAAVLPGPGRGILKGAWIALSHRHANMDVLVTLGTIAAWVTAVLAFADLPIRSFGVLAPMLPAFHLTGRLVEASLRRKAGADLRALMSAGGGSARILQEDGSVLDVPAESLTEGALIRVLTGEAIAADGTVVSGEGAVGEAMVSGEPVPVLKRAGDSVVGGTVLENGVLNVEVARVGENAFLSRMLRLVEQAQGVQMPLQALADRTAAVFVPVVFVLALAAFGVWAMLFPVLEPFLNWARGFLPWVPVDAGGWTTAVFALVSMLVAACPCALGLATPMALSVGGGLAARRGLLMKGGEAMQSAAGLSVLLMDKTGTLTEGRPEAADFSLSDEDGRAAAALEALSVHPLARAVMDWAAGRGWAGVSVPEATEVRETAGEGVEGRVNGVRYFVGRPGDSAAVSGGRTRVEVRREGVAVGWIDLADPEKEDAAAAVSALKARGVRPVMLTGDGPSAAEAVAATAGIAPDDVMHSLHPEDKLRMVQMFRDQGHSVGMVGDGINDAAALKAADVGFALAEGTDLSMEAGDIIITRGGLKRIAEAMDLSRLIVAAVKGNLIWAFVYNLMALPAAALALVHPLMAETAMTLSSVGVVLNSLAIRRRAAGKVPD